MTKDRWDELMTFSEKSLTDEEIAEGWHFCCEFDGLLIGPGMAELAYCNCEGVPEEELEKAREKEFGHDDCGL